jgi:pSer/pThr/pTyr-binding forkhead associated (FHA) protein
MDKAIVLVGISGVLKGRRIALAPDRRYRIGRSRKTDIRIDGHDETLRTVSGRHLDMRVLGSGLVKVFNRSPNGTFVDGARVDSDVTVDAGAGAHAVRFGANEAFVLERAASRAASPRLVGLAGHVKGAEISLEPGRRMVVGRSRSADISLTKMHPATPASAPPAAPAGQDASEGETLAAAAPATETSLRTVSGAHFEIEVNGDGLFALVNRSPNGTYVNGFFVSASVTGTFASTATEIRFGTDEVFRLEMVAPPGAVAPAGRHIGRAAAEAAGWAFSGVVHGALVALVLMISPVQQAFLQQDAPAAPEPVEVSLMRHEGLSEPPRLTSDEEPARLNMPILDLDQPLLADEARVDLPWPLADAADEGAHSNAVKDLDFVADAQGSGTGSLNDTSGLFGVGGVGSGSGSGDIGSFGFGSYGGHKDNKDAGDAVVLGAGFGGRDKKAKETLLKKFGGSPEGEDAVRLGLEWMKSRQAADGSWAAHPDVSRPLVRQYPYAMTGLATLCFLGAGHTEKNGPYKENVQKGVKWLIDHQHNQGIWPATMYESAIASMALSEAAGMAHVPETARAAQKAVDGLVKAQNQYAGWDYAPKWSGGKENDTSVTVWCMMALKSAKMAGLTVPGQAFIGVQKWCDSAQDLRGAKAGDYTYRGGLFAYRSSNNGFVTPGNGTMLLTAAGGVMRLFMGEKPDHPGIVGPCNLLLENNLPGTGRVMGRDRAVVTRELGDEAPGDYYLWYHATLLMFQKGGDHWEKWNRALQPLLVKKQVKGDLNDDGGSWKPEGSSMWCPDRIFSTTMAILSLEVYYRYLPMYQTGK